MITVVQDPFLFECQVGYVVKKYDSLMIDRFNIPGKH